MAEPALTLSEPPPGWRAGFARALLDAYPAWEDMTRLMKLGLDESLDRYVMRAPMDNAVVALLAWAEGDDRLADLVKAAVRVTPAHHGLRQCAQAIGLTLQPDDPKEQVANVGLALRMLVVDANVREALGGFRATFESADRRLQRVTADKALHDRLHDFQVFCFAPLVSLVRTYPLGETRAQLQVEALTFRTELQKIRAVASMPLLANDDLDWIDDHLAPAYDLLCVASDEANVGKLQQALLLIRGVVQVRPSMVNAQLIRAVQDLDLAALVTSLTAIKARLGSVADADELAARVERAATDLQALHTELTRLVDAHQKWQKVDNAVRLFDATLSQSLDGVSTTWAIVERASQRVLTEQEPWVTELRDVAALVAKAVADPAQAALSVFFPRFQSLAGARFYQVDKDVKQLCDRLAPIGKPLDEFVERLNDHGRA